MAWKLSWLTAGQCPQAVPRAGARGTVGLSERQSNPSLDLRVQPFSWEIDRLFLASILILDLFFMMALIECLFCLYKHRSNSALTFLPKDLGSMFSGSALQSYTTQAHETMFFVFFVFVFLCRRKVNSQLASSGGNTRSHIWFIRWGCSGLHLQDPFKPGDE